MEYRDAVKSRELFRQIEPYLHRSCERVGRKLRFMEVCGTHSVSFSKTGVRDLLSPYVELISGPGCPVCVTDQRDIDQMIAYAGKKDVIVATFGDMLSVPGTRSTLERERAKGADVRIVNAASQAVRLAEGFPSRDVIFLGVGFETTAPGVALTLKEAESKGLRNYFVYSAHKRTPPALDSLLSDESHRLDGFILPGHVSVIIGLSGWSHLEERNVPAVIGGFDPMDLLLSIGILTRDLERERRMVRNLYPRVVTQGGNPAAQRLLSECFEVTDAPWRGFGSLQRSGYAIHRNYAAYDASIHIEAPVSMTTVIKGCRCGEIVKGKESPFDCKLFGKACTPVQPLGPCMVSSEGTCSTYFRYERTKQRNA